MAKIKKTNGTNAGKDAEQALLHCWWAHTATALWESAWRVLQSMGFDSDCPEFIDGRGADLPGIVFQSMNLGCLSTYVGALYSFQPFL